MTEKNAFREALGQRGAIPHYGWLVRADTIVVNGTSEEFIDSPGLTADKRASFTLSGMGHEDQAKSPTWNWS